MPDGLAHQKFKVRESCRAALSVLGERHDTRPALLLALLRCRDVHAGRELVRLYGEYCRALPAYGREYPHLASFSGVELPGAYSRLHERAKARAGQKPDDVPDETWLYQTWKAAGREYVEAMFAAGLPRPRIREAVLRAARVEDEGVRPMGYEP